MKLLELFAGTRSVGKAFEKRGHKVFSVEWNKDFEDIDLYDDILNVTSQHILDLFGRPDVIWASPDCSTFSIAAISRHRIKNPTTGSLDDELEQKRKNYRDKLMAIGGDLFSVEEIENPDGSKTKQYTVNSVDEQLRRMREYNSAVKKLRAEGMSDLMLSDLTSMNDEDSMQFAKYLSGMSASEFAQINELYNEKQKLADELANDLYKDDAQRISDSMTSALGDLATSAYSYGAQAAEEFSKGFSEAANKLGLNSLYSQLQAAGSTKTYENYLTVNQSVPDVNVTVTPGKTSIYLDGKKLGEANTTYESQQSKITGK